MNMTRILFTICMCNVFFIPQGMIYADSPADEAKVLLDNKPVEISADLAFYSKYVWRGFKLDDDPVMQSGLYIDAYGFSLSLWGNLDMEGRDSSKSDEIDYTAGYTYNMADNFNMPVSVTGGYIYYNFPSQKTNSQEFYIGLLIDTMLSPSFTWYHDFEDEQKGGGKGDYMAVKLSHSFPLPNMPASIDINAHAGYNNKLFLQGTGGDIGIGAGITFELTRNSKLSPSVNYSIPLGDMKEPCDGNQKEVFYTGAIFTIGF
jgi:hypothetical protein